MTASAAIIHVNGSSMANCINLKTFSKHAKKQKQNVLQEELKQHHSDIEQISYIELSKK